MMPEVRLELREDGMLWVILTHDRTTTDVIEMTFQEALRLADMITTTQNRLRQEQMFGSVLSEERTTIAK